MCNPVFLPLSLLPHSHISLNVPGSQFPLFHLLFSMHSCPPQEGNDRFSGVITQWLPMLWLTPHKALVPLQPPAASKVLSSSNLQSKQQTDLFSWKHFLIFLLWLSPQYSGIDVDHLFQPHGLDVIQKPHTEQTKSTVCRERMYSVEIYYT